MSNPRNPQDIELSEIKSLSSIISEGDMKKAADLLAKNASLLTEKNHRNISPLDILIDPKKVSAKKLMTLLSHLLNVALSNPLQNDHRNLNIYLENQFYAARKIFKAVPGLLKKTLDNSEDPLAKTILRLNKKDNIKTNPCAKKFFEDVNTILDEKYAADTAPPLRSSQAQIFSAFAANNPPPTIQPESPPSPPNNLQPIADKLDEAIYSLTTLLDDMKKHNEAMKDSRHQLEARQQKYSFSKTTL